MESDIQDMALGVEENCIISVYGKIKNCVI